MKEYKLIRLSLNSQEELKNSEKLLNKFALEGWIVKSVNVYGQHQHYLVYTLERYIKNKI